MQERMKRNIKGPITIQKVIKLVETILTMHKEELMEDYEIEGISFDEIEDIEDDSILDSWESEVDDIDEEFIRGKIEEVISSNDDYFALNEDNVYFNFSISIEDVQDRVNFYLPDLLDSFLQNIESDVKILKLIGITFREKELNAILKNEKDLQMLYFGGEDGEGISLLSCYINGESNEAVVKKIKKKLLISKILWFNYFNSLKTPIEYSDSFTYLASLGYNFEYPIKSGDLDEENIEENYQNSFLDTLFVSEDNGSSLACEKLELGIVECGNPLIEDINSDDSYWREEENFYITFLYFLEEEIKSLNSFDGEIRNYFLSIKFKLMETLDYVCDSTLFQDGIPTDVLKTFPSSGHLSFVLINDILSYPDESYQGEYDSQNFTGRLNYLNNIIKKLIIKTYYFLSEDKEIEEHIKSNPNYKRNLISSSLLEDALNIKKNLTLKKIK